MIEQGTDLDNCFRIPKPKHVDVRFHLNSFNAKDSIFTINNRMSAVLKVGVLVLFMKLKAKRNEAKHYKNKYIASLECFGVFYFMHTFRNS